MAGRDKPKQSKRPAGVCIPWEQKLAELEKISGDKELLEKVWQDIDVLAYIYIWHCLLSF
ncbi:MAG: hypothetical protein JXB29_13100 [Sedimentisphaerales bacterium]|nr:hypothetical protein [Sedimentisphaerales bacterium]